MKLKKKRREGAGNVPTDSMSDVAFLLIIFFIVATTLNTYSGFKAEIPSSQIGEENKNTTTVKVNGNSYFLSEKPVTIEELRKQLKALNLPGKKTEGDRVVVLEATDSVTYQTYFSAMAAITKAGGAVTIVIDEGDKETEKDKNKE